MIQGITDRYSTTYGSTFVLSKVRKVRKYSISRNTNISVLPYTYCTSTCTLVVVPSPFSLAAAISPFSLFWPNAKLADMHLNYESVRPWLAFLTGGTVVVALNVFAFCFSVRNFLSTTEKPALDGSQCFSNVKKPPRPRPEDPILHSRDVILAEHFTRNIQFFGSEAQRRVTGAFVIVVGLGGVGSHCAHMLLRSGVSRLRLVDFDHISLSSLNRHAVATRADVGKNKAECLAAQFRRIFPEALLDVRVAMYNKDSEAELLCNNPDFVVDCIDNIDTKVDLLAACYHRDIPVLSCGGAGSKCDPTRVRIVDLAESVVDPLSRAVRHRLRRSYQVERGIPIVLSTEKQHCKLVVRLHPQSD